MKNLYKSLTGNDTFRLLGRSGNMASFRRRTGKQIVRVPRYRVPLIMREFTSEEYALEPWRLFYVRIDQ